MKTQLITIAAILTIGGLAALALIKGMDGVALTASIGIIAALGGYQAGKRKGKPPTSNSSTP